MRVLFGAEQQSAGVQGTMCSQIASPEPQWVVAEYGEYMNAKFPLKGYGILTVFGEDLIYCRWSTTRDQPARQVG